MWDTVFIFVYFDYDPGCYEGCESEVIEDGVGVGSFFLLLGCVGWLEDESALGEEE